MPSLLMALWSKVAEKAAAGDRNAEAITMLIGAALIFLAGLVLSGLWPTYWKEN